MNGHQPQAIAKKTYQELLGVTIVSHACFHASITEELQKCCDSLFLFGTVAAILRLRQGAGAAAGNC